MWFDVEMFYTINKDNLLEILITYFWTKQIK